MNLPINQILNGDAIEHMKQMPENSIDAIITDPPYGLEFMGKDWDKFKEGKNIAGGTTGKDTPFGRSKPLNSVYQYKLSQKREMQNFFFGWAIECLRVLKPGGFLLSMGGTRTYHRLVCGIEDAGFEIRDTIMWLYGSGFPKSLNIGKQIDKIQGNEREVVGEKIRGDVQKAKDKGAGYLSDPANRNNKKQFGYGKEILTKGSSEWEGWGTALKPAVEPIVVARKPLSEKNVALNVLKWGTGGINIDECRIPTNPEVDDMLRKVDRSKRESETWEDGSGFKNENNSLTGVRQDGRFPANIILECICDELKEGKAKGSQGHWSKTKTKGFGDFGGGSSEYFGVGPKDNMKCIIHTNPNCPCYMLDEQSGILSSNSLAIRNTSNTGGTGNVYTTTNDNVGNIVSIKGKGGASRFFYCAKASKSERNYGCEELGEKEPGHDFGTKLGVKRSERIHTKKTNNHPTVKPIKLMEYLIKLVSRENAIVLDPFIGSGTTAIACLKLNRKFIGIEKEEEYIKIAKARIKPYLEQTKLK